MNTHGHHGVAEEAGHRAIKEALGELEKKLRQKDEVLAEVMVEYVALKKKGGGQ